MGNIVDAILATLPSLKLNQTEQATFLALAEKLRKDSTELRNLALVGDNQVDAIPGQLDQIDVTCKACHQLFREIGG
jgi:cytochrome c556